ncbi:uncharacterized protein LOC120513109 isoform X3 [Passer montanus]|uniref:uncharacterized protein LOC120513109 isoform X3 n=1 Tax=Passer montanus TaxID=9160 RepID=UPI00196110CA|nr:uncharacterized protein LOC120513109 isoform X3 [Passer montanus]
MPGPPQQPTDSHGGGPGSPPAAVDTELAQPSSSPRGNTDTDTPQVTPAGVGRAPQVFIVEDQPPVLRAPLLRLPCELVLDMGFVPALRDPGSQERQELLHSFNQTVAPLFAPVPGFLRLEVTGLRWVLARCRGGSRCPARLSRAGSARAELAVPQAACPRREGSVVLRYDALFAAEQLPLPGLEQLLEAALGSARARPGLAVGTAPVLRHVALARPLDPCALLFTCPAGFACVSRADGNVTCTSLCHRAYCKNQGICSHGRDHQPRCHYRRFCRLDDVSAQYWSRSGLPSASSLDNPAFSNSEELLQLQVLDGGCCGCRGDSAGSDGAKRGPAPCAHPQCQPSFHYEWDTSSSSMNEPMVDSGKASDISVSSWPMEPIQWAPFPLHQLSRQRAHKARWPQPFSEGLELGTLERSWTA